MPRTFDDVVKALQLDFSRLRLPAAYIDGIEATQTIQYYKSDQHLTDPATRAADNAVLLAAYKPAWVRTYVRSGLVGNQTVRGTLTVERRYDGFLWSPVATLVPQPPGSVTASPSVDYATERGSTARTLNFIIPASNCYGVLRLTVALLDAAGNTLDTSSVVVRATLKQTLRLRGILIGYNGPSTAVTTPGAPPPPNVTLAAPTLSNLQGTAARALLAMPVQSTGNFAVSSTIVFNLPLDDARSSAGGCSTNWGTLLTQLATQRTNDGNRADVVYFGLLPSGMPINVPGCGNNGLGAGRVGDQSTLLHEIGHGYGFAHTPCGAAGTTDPNYPNYKPYGSASIGEYGLDISNGAVFSPATTSDYMSYCFPQWMSLYQHERLVGHARLDPSWITDHPIWDQYVRVRDYIIPEYIPDPPPDLWRVVQMRPDPVISIIGVIHSDAEVEITSVARVRAVSVPPGRATQLLAHLRDANGREIARAAVHDIGTQGRGCDCCGDEERKPGEPPYVFQALVPDVARGAALAISAEARNIWERHAPEREPKVDAPQATITSSGTLRLTWRAEVGGEHYEAWVQWSNAEARIWHGLATGLTEREAELSLAGLPAGSVLLRVLVHDGFSTAVSDIARIEVPRQPPEAAILSPEDGGVVIAGGPMRLWAAATDQSGQPLTDEACLWMLDEQEVGRGADVWVRAPAAGQHRVSLIVRSDDQQIERVAHFNAVRVMERPEGPSIQSTT